MGIVDFGFSKALKRAALLTTIIGLAGAGLVGGALGQERVMIVMDGSGSMWGQIDGVPKLSIARDTLRTVLPGVPATTELGLIAYGHREKGNCQDIEMVVAPATETASQISEAVDEMRFLGKTPLSAAVKIAAQELRFTEDKATVILITDGIETCSADPCALGNLLEDQGVDFTAHVVGFGLSEEEGQQISCLAENTGGKFFLADDGDGLVEALNEVVVAEVPAVVTPDVRFVAVDQDDNQVIEPLSWIIQTSGGETVAQTENADKFITPLEAGDYMVLVSGADISGGMEFALEHQDAGTQIIQVPVEITLLLATLDAPESAAAGSEFDVTWTGPNDKSDYVTIVELGAREGSYLNYAYTGNGAPAEITAPDGLGTFELRYVHGPSDKTLATRNIEITAISGTLEAPDSVAAGAEFEVIWTGPDNKNDYVTIVAVGADEGDYGDYAYTGNGNPAEIAAPDGIGTYEIRYVLNQSDRTLVSRIIEVTAVSGTLDAPQSAPAGSEIEVTWTGPDNRNDFITVVEVGADEGAYNDYARTHSGEVVELTMPDAVGTFEIRYVIDSSNRTLVSREIELTEVSGTLNVENTPVPGGELSVSWTGPDNSNDFITIVETGAPEGSYNDYARTRNGSPAVVDIPRALGSFEVRYVVDASNRTLVSIPITLAPASATLAATASVAAGGVVEVKWTGPGNRNDFIEIVPADSDADVSAITEARTVQGSPLSLFAPGSAGSYVVRYKMRDTGEVLASSNLTVE